MEASPIIIIPNKIGLSVKLNKNSSNWTFISGLTSVVVVSSGSSTSCGIIVTG